MDTIISLTGDGYVLMAADRTQARSIVVMKSDLDKITQLDSHKILGGADLSSGDRDHFSEFVSKNLALYELRNDQSLSTKAAAHWTRSQLATALRRGPYQVNLLLGGVDNGTSSLYFLDHLAACHKVDFGCHGYASYFTLSILDKYWKKGLSLDEGKAIMARCVAEAQKRFVMAQPTFTVKLVTAEGTTEIDLDDVMQDE